MDIKENDLVRFRADSEGTMLVGRVTRAPWGPKQNTVSMRTLDEQARIFSRLIAEVEVIEVPAP